MTKRKYTITIHTSRCKGIQGTFPDVPYLKKSPKAQGDRIKIYSQKIVIVAERNKKYDLESIIEYKQNSLYQQIYKSLLCLFLKKGKRTFIRSIEVKVGNSVEKLLVDKNRQPIDGDFVVHIPIPPLVLGILWEETVRGKTLRASISHYLIAISSKDRYKRFERLWRSFEQIAVWHKYHDAIPTHPSDFESLCEMRSYICSNPQALQQTFMFIDKVGSRKLGKLHWRKLIDNNYPYSGNKKQVERLYSDFCDKNKDVRLTRVFKKVITMRKSAIDSHGLTNDFETLINSYVTNRLHNNSHVLSLIVCKYCFFMRNKMFHGEEADFSFCFTNHTEDDSITDFLNELLERLVNELIVGFDSL